MTPFQKRTEADTLWRMADYCRRAGQTKLAKSFARRAKRLKAASKVEASR